MASFADYAAKIPSKGLPEYMSNYHCESTFGERKQAEWQVDKSLSECNKYMLEQQINCDVTFQFNKDEEPKPSISAHTYVLASRSPVFFAMFMGPAKEQSNTVKITDVDKDSFTEMLRFIYHEKVTLTGDNVMAILYLAKKYHLNQLLRQCNNFLVKNLDSSNVCSILSHALHLDEQDLVKKCYNIIDNKTNAVLNSESFLELPLETLQTIMERDEISGATEIEIFNGCVKWAEQDCRRRGFNVHALMKRQVLGNALHLIRFPLMPLDVFSNQVTTTGLLNKEETLAVFLYLTRKGTKRTDEWLPFSTKKRSLKTSQNRDMYFAPYCPNCGARRGFSFAYYGTCEGCGST